jgi:CDGSH-type Zn-finger protein
VIAGGPLVVEGAPLARVVKGEPATDGPLAWSAEPIDDVGDRYVLCRCDGSAAKPFCDRWPDRLPCFEEPEHGSSLMPSFTWRPPDGVDGPLVALKPNGPVRVSGGVVIEPDDGIALGRSDRVSLCRCGRSGVMPYCDGSHKEVGFRDD